MPVPVPIPVPVPVPMLALSCGRGGGGSEGGGGGGRLAGLGHAGRQSIHASIVTASPAGRHTLPCPPRRPPNRPALGGRR